MIKEKVEIQIINIVNQLILKCWQLLQSEETTQTQQCRTNQQRNKAFYGLPLSVSH